MKNLIIVTLLGLIKIRDIRADNFDILIDTKANSIHRLDSLNLLIYCKSQKNSIFSDKD